MMRINLPSFFKTSTSPVPGNDGPGLSGTSGNRSSASAPVRSETAPPNSDIRQTTGKMNLAQAKVLADLMRTSLGAPMAGGVLQREIATENFGAVNVSDVMNQYARDIGSKLSPREVETYINMGERLVHAIGNKEPGAGKELTVKGGDGRAFNVSSNLETTRAISWYLQAKAVMDNASPDRDPVVLGKGSMLMKDEGSKLFDFLNGSSNAYGRLSTHFNERSNSMPANLSNTGLAGGVAGMLKPGAAQKGIEDFSNRMPSGKGTVIFDKLKEKDGVPQLFLKWESVGMPSVFSKTVHADKEDGLKKALQRHIGAVGRCVTHSANFLHTITGTKKDVDWGVRREDVHKGASEHLYKDFKNIVAKVGKDKNLIKTMQAEGKEKGLDFMTDELEKMRTDMANSPGHEQTKTKIDDLLGKINKFHDEMGENLGLDRKGSEVHVSLNTAYLTSPASQPSVSKT
ncbi:hypothetical protein [Paraherbaspirillum soli]|uniref:Uncharacterized protein n=1 Tax=Paraherbaspirillum soli TaxID=631222 RepID=A0ABW0MBP9_9BURK